VTRVLDCILVNWFKQIEFKFTFWLEDRNAIKVGSVTFAVLDIAKSWGELKCDELDIYT
jgi:hypothetical protein